MELITSTETGSVVTYSSEETYKFRLSALRAPLLEHFLSNPEAIYPKPYYDQVVRQLQPDSEDGALEDISVSRPKSRLEWGVRVPGDEEQTIYVWIDALTVYLTGAGYPWTDQDRGMREGGWPANLQIIGKDILRRVLFLFLSHPVPPADADPDSTLYTSQPSSWHCPFLSLRPSLRTRTGRRTKRRCPNPSGTSRTRCRPWMCME